MIILAGPGCSSTQVPPPPPESIRLADLAASDAARHEQRDQWDAAASAWRTAADRSELLNRREAQAAALHNLARAQRRLGREVEALDTLEQAAAINQAAGNMSAWWRNQVALLQLEAAMGREDALDRRLTGLAPRTSTIGDSATRAHYLNELGLRELARGRFDQARDRFESARREFVRAENLEGEAAVTANEAALFEATQDWPAALERWQSAMTLFEQMGDASGIASAYAGQGRSSLAIGADPARAEAMLRRAVRHYEMLGDSDAAARTSAWLTRVLESGAPVGDRTLDPAASAGE